MKTLQLEKLESKDPKVKYGFAKQLLKIGADSPQLLYEHFNHWAKLLDDPSSILKWIGIDLIGYLSDVDTHNKVDRKIPELFRLLHNGHLITCNHAISALAHIALSKPAYRMSILNELCSINGDKFETKECREIAVGKVIDSLEPFLNDIKGDITAVNFIREAASSKRNSTWKKANLLLTKMLKP